MLNISVTPVVSLTWWWETVSSDEKGDDDAEYREEKELEEEEESEEKADKDDEEEEEGRSKGATQARKVKLSLVVSESSWKYVMPNLFRVTCEKSGWFLRKDDNPKAIFDTFFHIYMDACIYIYKSTQEENNKWRWMFCIVF